jgi:signal transduction histidine kinase
MQRFNTDISQLAKKSDTGLSGEESVKLFPPPPMPSPDDPRIVFVFIDVNGEVIVPAFPSSLKQADIMDFTASATSSIPDNQMRNQHYYRFARFSYAESALPLVDLQSQLVRVKEIVVIANVDPEIRLLHTVVLVSTVGTLLVFLIIIGVGYFLARQALIPINESWEKQEQFVSNASHEMRTPLAVVRAHAELLLHSPDHTIEQESEHIASIIRESTRMSNLVSKLLLLARTDSNQAELEFQSVILPELIGNVVTQFRPIACLKEVSLHLQADEAFEFFCDKDRIVQLLVILFDNAVKYTPAGGDVTVQVRNLVNAAQIIVQDTGIGISTSDLPHIFDRFYQADTSRSGKERGTGLGLAIAKWIVEKHSGSIKAHSIAGKGTVITVVLPSKPFRDAHRHVHKS